MEERKSWGEAKAVARDSKCWADSVEALSSYWRDETCDDDDTMGIVTNMKYN